jgi:hypothetical protein
MKERFSEKLNVIEGALKAVIENSNAYGMVSWKWAKIEKQVMSAMDAITYLRNKTSLPDPGDEAFNSGDGIYRP